MFEAAVFGRSNINTFLEDMMSMYNDRLTKWKCMGYIDPFESQNWLPIKISNTGVLLAFYSLSLISCSIFLLGEIVFFRIMRKHQQIHTIKPCKFKRGWTTIKAFSANKSLIRHEHQMEENIRPASV